MMKDKLTLDDCLKLYEEEGIMGLVDRVKEISFKAGYEKAEKEGIVRLSGCKDGCALSIKDSRLAGQRDVVEWVEQHRRIFSGNTDDWCGWQAYKREKGL